MSTRTKLICDAVMIDCDDVTEAVVERKDKDEYDVILAVNPPLERLKLCWGECKGEERKT